ncbi:MAG: hypothetical protein LBL19_00655 [Spirochaetaceae bacterium]|nr:hypothetical protein [Spirochaetaceae bacterium]
MNIGNDLASNMTESGTREMLTGSNEVVRGGKGGAARQGQGNSPPFLSC